ncbi:type III secretion system invasion protein IagB [Serratia quinivorans]|uniref:type III secretion system invasion protein IagB n=1 Tax=Serratia quinivorans TaxID=137545 RepID=UPI0039821EA8
MTQRFLTPIFLVVSLSTFSHICYANCWYYAERSFGIEARLIAAIAQVESGMNPTTVGKNRDGTVDIGLMQINSSHLAKLKEIGIDEKKLKGDPCLSVLTGASILSDMMQIYGYSWEAVGAYNAGTGKMRHHLRMKYAKKVWEVYRKQDLAQKSIRESAIKRYAED